MRAFSPPISGTSCHWFPRARSPSCFLLPEFDVALWLKGQAVTKWHSLGIWAIVLFRTSHNQSGKGISMARGYRSTR